MSRYYQQKPSSRNSKQLFIHVSQWPHLLILFNWTIPWIKGIHSIVVRDIITNTCLFEPPLHNFIPLFYADVIIYTCLESDNGLSWSFLTKYDPDRYKESKALMFGWCYLITYGSTHQHHSHICISCFLLWKYTVFVHCTWSQNTTSISTTLFHHVSSFRKHLEVIYSEYTYVHVGYISTSSLSAHFMPHTYWLKIIW